MPESILRNLWLEADDDRLKADCIIDFHKGSGNGGQKINKTSSAVRLIHKTSGLSAEDASERSQARNLSNALKKLRLRIALKVRNQASETSVMPVLSPPPSLGNVRAYALALALILDQFAALGWEPAPVAVRLGISKSKLMKLLFRDSALLQEVNGKRAGSGLAPLKNPK